MKALLASALLLVLAVPALAHDWRTRTHPTFSSPPVARSYGRPNRQRYYSSYTYDRPSSYRWRGDGGYYGSYHRPRFHRHWRDGASSASKNLGPRERW